MQKTEAREAVTLVNEGQKIFGIFHRPLGESSYPAILMCHGLAGHKAGRYRTYVNLAEKLAAHGIGVLRIDFRGSGDSEGDFSAMTLMGEVSDALVALQWLEHHDEIDKNRIGLFGRSLGGAVAVIAASEYKQCKSIALWCPIFSGDQWHDKWLIVKNNNGRPEHLSALCTINGQRGGILFFEELFRMRLEPHLARLSHLPLLHAHGLKDDVVLPTHAEAYKKERQHAEGASRFLLLPESDHDFSDITERQKAIHETCLWFENTL